MDIVKIPLTRGALAARADFTGRLLRQRALDIRATGRGAFRTLTPSSS